MPTVCFHTLGCKVNQYDSQAMLELFRAAGYRAVPFPEQADVYVINTCTVTGTGDKKSLQLLRRLLRQEPKTEVIAAGCLAQRMGEELLKTGVRLVIGNQRRGDIVSLFEKAVAEGIQINAVTPFAQTKFERLSITSHEDHTRAVMKIQEGCDNHCTYCIIPSVRGPIRSRPAEDIAQEALALAQAGFSEIVLTGIHLTSYGRDTGDTLLHAIQVVHDTPGIARVRLGSLEPTVVTDDFVRGLAAMPGICPQFHLALQSGSDTVLARMARKYNMKMYFAALDRMRETFPDAAFTTDVLTGFPGETEEELQETVAACRKAAFAKMHVFPYSPREGTKAAVMVGQLSRAEKERRARLLITLSDELGKEYRSRFIGRDVKVLFEEIEDNVPVGYTPEYIRVKAEGGVPGTIGSVHITSLWEDGLCGTLMK